MPHVPEPSQLSSLGMRVPLAAPARGKQLAAEQARLPWRQSADPSKARRQMVDRLSLRKYEPDLNKTIKTMFGREPNVDDHTGRTDILVSANPA